MPKQKRGALQAFGGTESSCTHHVEIWNLGVWDGSKLRKQKHIHQHGDSGNERPHGLPALPGKNLRNLIRKLICPHMVKENLMSNQPGRFKSLKLFSLISAQRFQTQLQILDPTGEFSENHFHVYLMWNLWPKQFIEQLKKGGVWKIWQLCSFGFCWQMVSTSYN